MSRSESILQQLVSARKLRWAGHVVRVDAGRLPRKFFSSWIKGVRTRSLHVIRAVGFNLDMRAQAIGVSRDCVRRAGSGRLAQSRCGGLVQLPG